MASFEEYLKVINDSLVADLRLPQDFLQKFRDEDDWSFVIKSHALVEAVVSVLEEKWNEYFGSKS